MNHNLPRLVQYARILPESPGVYTFLNRKGGVIYVGKAVNLRNRVRQYFSPGRDSRPQIPRLLEEIAEIKFFVTQNEREALILENSLIKENHPFFNISLKDDKTFKSLKISLEDKFPSVSTVRYRDSSGDRNAYFGPYCRIGDINSAIRTLLELFQLRDCSSAEFARRSKIKRPCLKYHVRQCSGPCAGYIHAEEYRDSVSQAVQFLKNRNNSVLDYFREKIKKYSAQLEYEKAAFYHRKMLAIISLKENKSFVAGFRKDADVIGFYSEEYDIAFQIMIIRQGRIISADAVFFRDKFGTPAELLRDFISQYYQDSSRIPPEIWCSEPPEDLQLLSEIMARKKGGDFRILTPAKGPEHDAVGMASENAELQFKHDRKKAVSADEISLRISRVLNMDRLPLHIECYDVSHSSGRDVCGSGISFRNMLPCKKEYRRYNVKTFEGNDDYGALYEILSRRVSKISGNADTPDLILVDGGPGQLGVLERVLKEHNIVSCGASIAKESHAKSSRDKIFVLGRKNPVLLERSDPALLKLMEIRDEAHRFAVNFFKKKREKRVLNA